jgi:tetratricopeptide (TPR) repeat protein
VVGAISAIITYISQSRTAIVGLPTEYGPERIPLVFCHNIVFYLYKIIWPVNLSSYYPYPAVFSLSNPMLMTGLIGSCVLIALLIISLRWTRAALTGWLIFFVAMLPTMQIIGFSNVIAADKFAYLPSIGLLMLLAAFATWFYSANKILIWRIAIVIVVLIAAGAESVGTRKYLVHWRSMISLSKYFLKLAPDAAQINLMTGCAFQREGKLDEAEYYCRRAAQLSPNYADAHNNLALVLKLQGKLDEAADQYRLALQCPLKDAIIHYNLGNTLQSLGKFDEAITQYLEALKINPEHAYSHNNLANALSALGRHDEAADHYQQALKIKPLYPEAYNNLGTILEIQGNLDKAIDYYSRALRIKPDFPAARYNLIHAFALQNKLDEVISYFRQVLQIKLEDAEVYNGLGMGLLVRGKIDEAIIQFNRAIQTKPDFLEAYHNLAFLFESQGNLDKAVTNYRKVLQFKPDAAEIHLKIGALLASQNKLDEAIGYFNQAVRLAPNNADAHCNIGEALAMTNKPREAIEHLKQAMQLKPYWYEPAIWLARILATCPDSEVRDPNNAVIIATHAAELTKHQNPEVLETLAAGYAAKGQFELAVKTAQEALALATATQNNELADYLRNIIERYKQAQH